MKAVVFHGVGEIRVDEVMKPRIRHPADAIVRITACAICGTDLHMIRGTLPGMKPGTILGHEGVGIVEELGSGVRNFMVGDRVVVAATIACGYCSYCRAGSYSQCDNANPSGRGTAFFGGPEATGAFDGMQAEYVRVPFANVGMLRLPDEVSDEQAIFLSDILPTGYFGADLAGVRDGDTVAVFGCGPVGQFAIASCLHLGAGRVLAVDTIGSRLEMARSQSAEIIDFNAEDPVETIRRLTGGIGVDRAIDAVGVDAEPAYSGQAATRSEAIIEKHRREVEEIAPETHPERGHWLPGEAPSQALEWAVESLAKTGTLGVIGVYPEKLEHFPIGTAMMKNLSVKLGSCNHRKYMPHLLELVRTGAMDPAKILTQVDRLTDAVHAYEAFDERQPGWMKVELLPAA